VYFLRESTKKKVSFSLCLFDKKKVSPPGAIGKKMMMCVCRFLNPDLATRATPAHVDTPAQKKKAIATITTTTTTTTTTRNNTTNEKSKSE
jgi:hypothetical protein